MKKKLNLLPVLGLAALAVMLNASVGTASATLITYQLTVDNCTGGCNPGAPGTSMGSVAVNDFGASGSVLVTVTLVSPLQFVNTGLQNTIDFNLSGITTGVGANTFSNANFSLAGTTAGAYHFDGFGDFQYSILLNTAQGAGGAVNASPLSFNITATGITAASFISTAASKGGVFGVDVYNSTTGRTGPIGTTGSTPTPTPEPISLSLVGGGLLALGLFRKRFAA